jgi:hypothetical protein
MVPTPSTLFPAIPSQPTIARLIVVKLKYIGKNLINNMD